MRHIINVFLLFALIATALMCCSGNRASESSQPQKDHKPGTIELPQVPSSLNTPGERAAFLVKNYWNNFEASDTLLINNEQVTEQYFVNLISILSLTDSTAIAQSCKTLFSHTAKNEEMTKYMLSLTEKYLYDGNSPFQNDAYFNIFIDNVDFRDMPKDLRSYWKRLKRISSMNNPGMKAQDIEWITSEGKKEKLSQLDSEYIILFFNNPDCDECKHIKRELLTLSTPKSCKIVSIYPDDDLNMWKRSLTSAPTWWINCYDPGMKITRDEKYDLKVIPSIYLLDNEKRVLLKDSSIEQLKEFFKNK